MEANNAAAMREALCEIVLLTVKAGKSISCDVACGIIASKAKHALRRLPRQCDVGTAEEQSERFDKFCHENINPQECCGDCPAFRSTRVDCELAWAQMPYETKEEGGAK